MSAIGIVQDADDWMYDLEQIKDDLINTKQIIGIKYVYTKRYKKSCWWKLWHKRYSRVVGVL